MNILRCLFSLLLIMSVYGAGNMAFSEQIGSNVILNADFRYRHELIDTEVKDMRNRQLIRARMSLSTKLNDEVKLGIQLASGSDNPVSTNQTLTGGFSSKPVNIDLAFFEWMPEAVKGLTVIGGKIKNPFYTPGETELLWDSDLRPEGIAIKYSNSRDSSKFFLSTSYFWVEERKEQNDAVLLASQAGINYSSSTADFLFGIGYFDYQNTKNNATFFDVSKSFGNSVDGNGYYLYDYNDIEIFCELTPNRIVKEVSVFFDYVKNIDSDVDDNMGWLVGFSVGECKNPGSSAIRYTYRNIERDAVIGVFTDYAFIGGGTDGKGHEANFSYQVTAKTKLKASYFFNQIGIDDGKDYHRVQIDVNFKL